MKSIEELEQIFSVIKTENTQNYDFSSGKDWKIVFFRPFERNNHRIYSFRLYGRITESKFKKYNEELQWCGGIDYEYDLKTTKLNRSSYTRKLHDIITLQINPIEILEKI